MKKFVLASGLALLVFSGALSAAEALDGKTFTAEVGHKGKQQGQSDELVFADGKFHSTAFQKSGFADGTYTSKVDGDKTTFEAVLKSDKAGTMTWKGTVQGDAISGQATWNKVRRTPAAYWVKGSVKK